MEIRHALVRFIICQETFGCCNLFHTDYVLGHLEPVVLALEITCHEVIAFWASSDFASHGWGHLATLQLGGLILDPIEEVIIHTDLRWTQRMPFRLTVTRVAQLLIAHFYMGGYLL